MAENPPAFPHESFDFEADMDTVKPGMSLRDWFAGQVLEQCIRNAMDNDGGWDPHNVAYHAYLIAGAMLAARAKEGHPHGT